MFGLGIPTTRALALITGNDAVQREEVERSALLARVFPSNLRFGHFEYCFHFGFKEELNQLIEYAHKYFFNNSGTVTEILEEVVLRTADLIAAWQAIGFCHGVMNTDNMSFLGLTIDYGPFGFLEDTKLDHVCNHSDHEGRYSYYKQPQIALWNLERLLICFTPVVDRAELERILGLYVPRYEKAWLDSFRKKLGLVRRLDHDFAMVAELLKVLHENQIDFTFFLRSLCAYEIGCPESLSVFWEQYSKSSQQFPELLNWLKTYDSRLQEEQGSSGQASSEQASYGQASPGQPSSRQSPATERSQAMRMANPKYILRNYIAEEIIKSVEQNQMDSIHQWLNILLSPYDEHPEMQRYSYPTEAERKNLIVSCSS